MSSQMIEPGEGPIGHTLQCRPQGQ